MIFFVEHHAEPVLNQERGAGTHPPVGIQTSQFLADKMPLVKELAVVPLEAVEAELDGPPEQHCVPSSGLYGLKNVLSFGLRIPSLVHPPGKISCQTNAGRQNQMTGGTARIEPADSAVGEKAEVNHSITRKRSRSSAANSKFSVSTASRSCSRSSAALCRSSGAVLPTPSA